MFLYYSCDCGHHLNEYFDPSNSSTLEISFLLYEIVY